MYVYGPGDVPVTIIVPSDKLHGGYTVKVI